MPPTVIRRSIVPVWCALVLLLGASPAHAQSFDEGGPPPDILYEPPFIGFYFGVGLGPQVDLSAEDLCSVAAGCLEGPGAGLDLALGMRFSPWFKLQAGYDAYWHDSDTPETIAVVQAFRLDSRITVPVRSNFEPFGQIGFGLYTFGDEFAVDTAGPGLQVGGGVDVAVSRRVSLALTLLYRATRLGSTGVAGPTLPAVESAVFFHTLTAMVEASFGGGI